MINSKEEQNPYCIEVSWEVANPVGGIHTVLATKAESMVARWNHRYIVMGPWLNKNQPNPYWRDEPWINTNELLESSRAKHYGVQLRAGRWLIKGEPRGLLVDFSEMWRSKNSFLSRYWELFALDSLFGAFDYEEPVLFGAACGLTVEALSHHFNLDDGEGIVLHAHEWMTGSAILEARHRLPNAATVFTTHATALGRALASYSQIPNQKLEASAIVDLALSNGVRNKHSMEQVCADTSHVFTTVSEVTASECELFFLRKPDIVLPNAISDNIPDPAFASQAARQSARKYLIDLAAKTTGSKSENPLLVVTSGRYEFRNKGIDLVLDTLAEARSLFKEKLKRKLILFAMLPADSYSYPPSEVSGRQKFLTHDLSNPTGDPILQSLARHSFTNNADDPIQIIFVPRYLDGRDSLIPYTYWQLLAGMDLSLFPSWYEPWGYTPMEAVALGVPTISSDMAGFAHWAQAKGGPEQTGVFVLNRFQQASAEKVKNELRDILFSFTLNSHSYETALAKLKDQGTWTHAIQHYNQAHDLALKRTRDLRESPGPRLNTTRPESLEKIDVAYLSMEFALNADLPIYSGGLGVLAGDHLKAANDLKLKICGISIAYQEGYFSQRVRAGTGQLEVPQLHRSFAELGLNQILTSAKKPLYFDVPSPDGRQIRTTAWKLNLGGSSTLILLDPNHEENPPELRALSKNLYVSDRDLRWAQEFFLGMGAVILLEILSIELPAFHLNEGHTALSTFARIHHLKKKQYITVGDALQKIRKQTIFTTHTPVPAGLERFEWPRIDNGMNTIAALLRVDPKFIKSIGTDPTAIGNGFSMTALATRSATIVNSVALLHSYVSRALLDPIIDHYPKRRKPPTLTWVTNGIHVQTWLSDPMKSLFKYELGSDWEKLLNQPQFWQSLKQVADSKIWTTHLEAKQNLIDGIFSKFSANSNIDPLRLGAINRTFELLKKSPMIISFARRFAAYKRSELLFKHPVRFSEILSQFPNVVMLFAGKAHPADPEGKDRISRILALENSNEFRGHILFIDDYDLNIAKLMISGSDLWLNLPLQLREASGTSGMKAAINGVLNLSTNDGWVFEATHGEVPWVIGKGLETLCPAEQDEIHAHELYRLLEKEILPEYFENKKIEGNSQWVKRMKLSIAESIPRFGAQRMLAEYTHLYQSIVS
jgi:starch phosphorylase